MTLFSKAPACTGFSERLMLKKEGKINDAFIENMLSRHHTGFHLHVGGRIRPEDETALGNLAKYILRASFSQERMVRIPSEKSPDGSAKAACQSKDGRTEQTFDALDWLRKARRSYSKQIRAARRIRRLLFQQVPGHAQKGGNRRRRPVDHARRIDVETVPPQPGEADAKNLRTRSAPLSQLRASNRGSYRSSMPARSSRRSWSTSTIPRGAFEKPVVFFLTKSEQLSCFIDLSDLALAATHEKNLLGRMELACIVFADMPPRE